MKPPETSDLVYEMIWEAGSRKPVSLLPALTKQEALWLFPVLFIGHVDERLPYVAFRAQRFDLQTQDFYGLGPDSTLAGHAVYRHLETSLGATAYIPVQSLSGTFQGLAQLRGELNYLRPITKGVIGSSFPSVNALYGEVGAPASTTQPSFVELGAGVDFTPPTFVRSLKWIGDGAVSYKHYFEQGSSQYSFGRLEGWDNVHFNLLIHRDSKKETRWSNVACMQWPINHCNIGTLTFAGRVTTSYTSANSAVPFYLQPTLGGTDFSGVDTLRGFVDYRFRDPNRLLFQVDFDKAVYVLGVGPVRPMFGLYGFFDAGNVAPTPGQLIDHGLRTNAGIGASISLLNSKTLLRLYYGFGSGEGNHLNWKLPNAIF